jgi:hypothetical protein
MARIRIGSKWFAVLGWLAALGTISLPHAVSAAMPGVPGGGNAQQSPPGSGLVPPSLPPGGPEVLCALRDEALGNAGDLFEKLQLNEVFRNYYCDGGCYMCCYVPSQNACHTSFDYGENGEPPINCSPGVYGAGTTIVGEALIYGDSLGLGICVGGVQQSCHHFPICNGGASSLQGASAGDGGASLQGASAPGGEPQTDAPPLMGATSSATGSPPPHPDMQAPGANGSRAKALVKMMLQRFAEVMRARPAHLPLRDWVDFATARGSENWRAAMTGIEPYSGAFDAFRVEDTNGFLLAQESFERGIFYHASLALLGSVPSVLERLAHAESRFWTAEEIDDYLDGIDPEAELRRTMGPIALSVLKELPIQDWRLLARAAPGETPLAYRSYEGFALGVAPRVSAVQDCGQPDEVKIAVRIDDPQATAGSDPLYPVTVNWGDGTFSAHEYDRNLASNVFRHEYAAAGRYLAYVTASNQSGLRGTAGVVVAALQAGSDPAPPSVASAELDELRAFGPALISAGSLSFGLEGVDADGAVIPLGYSAEVTLPNAGSIALGGLAGHNDTYAPLSKLVLRPQTGGGYRYDSVYVQLPSITLGFWDPELGAITTRTVPVDPEMFQVYYAGANAPIPPALLERDVDGELMLPIDRTVPGLASGFCGSTACKLVERIEITLTPELLAGRPDSGPNAPAALATGSLARWREDVPNTFVAETGSGSETVTGSCGPVQAALVAADAPLASGVTALEITGPDPIASQGHPVDLGAIATLADGRLLDVTDRVRWSSSDPSVLRVSNAADKGQLSAGLVPGSATITASLGELEASVPGSNGSPAEGFAHYRIQFSKVHGSAGRAGLSGVELLAGPQTLENQRSSDASGSFGPFAAAVSSSAGGTARYAFDASLGTAWLSNTGSFNTTAPYAASNPVYLQIDFGMPVPIDGIRLHRMGGILSVSFVPQFPKEIVVQGSNDGANWHDVVLHVVENWDHGPVEIRWSAAADSDGDGAVDSADSCPAWPNPDQRDTDANGIGNDCECGDQNGSGKVDVQDLVAINSAIFNPAQASPLCDTNGDRRCDVQDLIGAQLKIFGKPAWCERYPQP